MTPLRDFEVDAVREFHNLPDDHALGELHVLGEQPRLPDHDRLRLVGHETPRHQGVVQAGRVVVPARLPLDPGDRGILLVVRESGVDELVA